MGLTTFTIIYILAYVIKRCKDKGLLSQCVETYKHKETKGEYYIHPL